MDVLVYCPSLARCRRLADALRGAGFGALTTCHIDSVSQVVLNLPFEAIVVDCGGRISTSVAIAERLRRLCPRRVPILALADGSPDGIRALKEVTEAVLMNDDHLIRMLDVLARYAPPIEAQSIQGPPEMSEGPYLAN